MASLFEECSVLKEVSGLLYEYNISEEAAPNQFQNMELLPSEKYSIMNEIAKTEEAIKNCYNRVDALEKNLRSEDLPEASKEDIRTELREVRKLLSTNEQQLSQLHKHNRKTFAFVAALCFVCFAVYSLYILIGGKDF